MALICFMNGEMIDVLMVLSNSTDWQRVELKR